MKGGIFAFERVTGIEPVYRLWKSRIITIILYPLIYLKTNFYLEIILLSTFGLLGIEPSQRAPKARVLPVYDSPTICPTLKRAWGKFIEKEFLFIQIEMVQRWEQPASEPFL